MTAAKVECLYVENERDDRRLYAGLIAEAWTDQFPSVDMEMVTVSSADRALNVIAEGTGRFTFAVVDILLTKDKQPLGLQVINKLRDSGIAIIAFSRDSEQGNNALVGGAHEWVYKKWLLSRPNAAHDLGLLISSALKKAGIDHPVPPAEIELSWSREDLQLEAAILTIGEETLRTLVIQLLEGTPANVKVTPVRPGLSGAVVLRLHCKFPHGADDGPAEETLLLKLSRDPESLERERRSAERIRYFAPGLFVPLDRGPVASGGWHAIASTFRNGSTLVDWLGQGPSESSVGNCLEQLFGTSGLMLGYAGSAVDSSLKLPEVADARLLTYGRRARIELAARDLTGVAKRHNQQAEASLAVVDTFVKYRRFGEVDPARTPPGICLVRSHGDLHGRNVLVEDRNRPLLIDPANIEMLPWTSDWARLAVDLLISVEAVGDEAYEWSGLDTWLADADGFVRGVGSQLTMRAPFAAGLSWLRTAVHGLQPIKGASPETLEWQIMLSLAVELLRGSYRSQELPPPRRVFALLAGAAALTAASDACLKVT